MVTAVLHQTERHEKGCGLFRQIRGGVDIGNDFACIYFRRFVKTQAVLQVEIEPAFPRGSKFFRFIGNIVRRV